MGNTQIRFLNYDCNYKGGEANRKKEKMKAKKLSDLIQREEPDIIALQKCNSNLYLSRLDLEDYQVFQSPDSKFGKRNIMAINHRIEIKETEMLETTGTLSQQISCRCLLLGYEFQVTCAHLKAGRTPVSRQIRLDQFRTRTESRLLHLIYHSYPRN